MDPITTSLVAAISAGVASAGQDVLINAIKDGYAGIKALIIKKYGKDSSINKAVESLEEKPDSAGRRAVLEEEVEAAGANQDDELVIASRELLEKIKELPRTYTNVSQTVTGDKNIFSGTGDVRVQK
jgi:hypothetical protein